MKTVTFFTLKLAYFNKEENIKNMILIIQMFNSMMKTLLFHAKMKYIKCGETQGMARCELYQSRIDLLALLVADNYQDLPSLQELTKSDIIM